MTPEKIARINELAKKQKAGTLTDAEKEEQAALRIPSERCRQPQTTAEQRGICRAGRQKNKTLSQQEEKITFPLDKVKLHMV